MESTLSVTDAAYNSGRRSRSNSFNSASREDLLQPTHQELSPDPHLEGHDATAIAYLDDNLAAFRSHRRHASDVSDISAGPPVAISPSILSIPYSDRAQSHSPAQSAAIFPEDNGLDEAFNSSLFMTEDYSGAASDNPYFLQQKRADSYSAQQQPFQNGMTQHGADAQYYMNTYTGTMPNTLGLAQGMTSTEAAALLHDPNFDNPAIFGERPFLEQQQQQQQQQPIQSPYLVRPGSSGPRQSQHSSFSGSESQLNRGFASSRTDQSQQSSPAWPRRHMQSPPAMLNVPGRESMYQSSGERTSPYSETPSFDGSSLGDLGSPAVSGMPLSRSNSMHSQISPQFDACLGSNPNSPFIPHDVFPDMQQGPEGYMGNFDNPYGNLSRAQVYEILGNYNNLRAAQQNMAFAQSAAMPIPGVGVDQYNSFEAPDIAINPPTPSGTSYMSRAQSRHYPFPQPVPIITTTTAPSSFDMPQPDYHDPDSLGVDPSRQQQRGRSHSDSRLMVHPGQVRSRSNSSNHSSRSRSTSRQPYSPGAGGASPGLLQKPSGGRIAKPGSPRHRRASWSGAPNDDGEDEDRDDETDVESNVSGNKQKNPATFICPVEGCGKAFTRAYNLRSHQRTHTNERPFLCEICSKGFARQHDRKRHEKLHSNERPFSCPGCKKKFARMDALSRHFKSEMGKDCIIGNPEYEHFLLDDDNS